MKTLYKLLYPALAFAAMAFVLITACQKLDFGTVTKSNIQNVTVRDASTVKVELQIFDLSDDAHPDYGVCYSETNQLPTVADSIVAKGAPGTIKTDSIILQGLQPGSKIYIRAFVMNGSNPQYSFNVKDVTPQFLPEASTLSATNITQTTAIINGMVNPNNNTTTIIFEYGTTTTYGQIINATPNTVTGTIGINVSASLTGLQASTSYHYRVKSSCANGTSFGNDITLSTFEGTLPVITTLEATNITAVSATSGGNVTSDGGSTITTRGICWSSSSNPNITGSHTSNGSGLGSFNSELTGLSPSTVYYLRAYATNSAGIAYGNELSFTTIFSCGAAFTINHDAGAVAPITKTVVYGTVTNIPGEPTKCWITQNLGATNQAMAIDDATEASAGWYWQFNRKQGYMHDGITRTPNTTWISNITENSDWVVENDPCRIFLGSNWRIPTNTEWTNVIVNGNWTNWNEPWNSELKLHAAGYLNDYNSSLAGRGSFGQYWSSTKYTTNFGWCFFLNSDYILMSHYYKAFGYSLRCVKD